MEQKDGETGMPSKVLLIVQPSLSHYREAFITSLLEHDDVHTYVLAGRINSSAQKNGADVVQSVSKSVSRNATGIERRELFGNFVWDKGLLRLALKERANLTILEGSFYNVSTLVTAILLKILGKKVAYWGHGWKRPESGLKLMARKIFYKIPNAHFVYGDWAAEFASKNGFDIEKWHVIYNSLYSKSTIELAGKAKPKERDPLVLVFSGRLTKRHNVSLLIEAVQLIVKNKHFDIKLVVIGGGSELENLKAQARTTPGNIEFLGPQHDFDTLYEIYSKSSYAVSPGASGLNVIQALGFGCPVIAAEGDPESGPEIEAIIDGQTGFLFEQGSVDSLKLAIMNAQMIDSHDYSHMSGLGRDMVLQKYNAESQAAAMLGGIRSILSDRNK